MSRESVWKRERIAPKFGMPHDPEKEVISLSLRFFSLPIAKGSGNAVMWHEIGTKTRQEPGKQPTTTFRIVNERRNPRSHFDSVSSFSSHSRSTPNRRTAEVKRLKNFIIVSVEKFLEHLWHNFFPMNLRSQFALRRLSRVCQGSQIIMKNGFWVQIWLRARSLSSTRRKWR